MTKDAMLTTVDNPWNPYTNWDEWLQYDEAAGYYSLSLLGRVVVTSDELSDSEQDEAISAAIDEVVQENVSGIHKKIYRDSEIKISGEF